MRVLVTGGAGFVGQYLARRLVGAGHQGAALDVHVDDVARLVAWAVEHPAPVGEPRVVNAGTGVRTTLLELARLAIAARPSSYAPVPVEVTHAEVRHDGDVDHACADLARLRALGAPTPTWSTADAVADQARAAWAGAPVPT